MNEWNIAILEQSPDPTASGLPFTFNLGPEYLERHRNRILYEANFAGMMFPREGEIGHLSGLDFSDNFYDKVSYANGMRLLAETCPGVDDRGTTARA